MYTITITWYSRSWSFVHFLRSEEIVNRRQTAHWGLRGSPLSFESVASVSWEWSVSLQLLQDLQHCAQTTIKPAVRCHWKTIPLCDGSCQFWTLGEAEGKPRRVNGNQVSVHCTAATFIPACIMGCLIPNISVIAVVIIFDRLEAGSRPDEAEIRYVQVEPSLGACPGYINSTPRKLQIQ